MGLIEWSNMGFQESPAVEEFHRYGDDNLSNVLGARRSNSLDRFARWGNTEPTTTNPVRFQGEWQPRRLQRSPGPKLQPPARAHDAPAGRQTIMSQLVHLGGARAAWPHGRTDTLHACAFWAVYKQLEFAAMSTGPQHAPTRRDDDAWRRACGVVESGFLARIGTPPLAHTEQASTALFMLLAEHGLWEREYGENTPQPHPWLFEAYAGTPNPRPGLDALGRHSGFAGRLVAHVSVDKMRELLGDLRPQGIDQFAPNIAQMGAAALNAARDVGRMQLDELEFVYDMLPDNPIRREFGFLVELEQAREADALGSEASGAGRNIALVEARNSFMERRRQHRRVHRAYVASLSR